MNTPEPILELSREPVLALREGKVERMNRAAHLAFPGCCVGDEAAELLPDPLIHPEAERFSGSVTVAEVRYDVIGARAGALVWLSLQPEDPEQSSRGLLTDALLSNMRSTLFNLGLSAERIRCELRPEQEALRDYLAILDHNYYALRHALGNLNLLCALEDGSMFVSPCRLDLVSLCSDIVSSAAAVTGEDCARPEFLTGLDALPVFMDGPKVELLILNLLANSLRATPRGGFVRLRLDPHGDDAALISVSDSGCGLPAAMLDNVFHGLRDLSAPGVMAALPGSGLGLPLCRVIAEKHGGTMILESREGEGTEVRVLLPLTPAGAGELRSGAPQYANGGPSVILTELSGLLDAEAYKLLLSEPKK